MFPRYCFFIMVLVSSIAAAVPDVESDLQTPEGESCPLMPQEPPPGSHLEELVKNGIPNMNNRPGASMDSGGASPQWIFDPSPPVSPEELGASLLQTVESKTPEELHSMERDLKRILSSAAEQMGVKLDTADGSPMAPPGRNRFLSKLQTSLVCVLKGAVRVTTGFSRGLSKFPLIKSITTKTLSFLLRASVLSMSLLTLRKALPVALAASVCWVFTIAYYPLTYYLHQIQLATPFGSMFPSPPNPKQVHPNMRPTVQSAMQYPRAYNLENPPTRIPIRAFQRWTVFPVFFGSIARLGMTASYLSCASASYAVGFQAPWARAQLGRASDRAMKAVYMWTKMLNNEPMAMLLDTCPLEILPHR